MQKKTYKKEHEQCRNVSYLTNSSGKDSMYSELLEGKVKLDELLVNLKRGISELQEIISKHEQEDV